MTQQEANQLHAMAVEEGMDPLFLNALPLGGFKHSGPNVGQPWSDQWYFSATVGNSDEKARLVCVLARAGATRANTDMIRDRDTYRITRIG